MAILSNITEEDINKKLASSPALASFIESPQLAQKISEISQKHNFDIDPDEDHSFHQLAALTILGFINTEELYSELKNNIEADDAEILGAAEEIKAILSTLPPAQTIPVPPVQMPPFISPAPATPRPLPIPTQVQFAPPIVPPAPMPTAPGMSIPQPAPIPAPLSIPITPPAAATMPIPQPAPKVVNYSATTPIAPKPAPTQTPTPIPAAAASPFVPPAMAPIAPSAPLAQPNPATININIAPQPTPSVPIPATPIISAVVPPSPLAVPITPAPAPIPQPAPLAMPITPAPIPQPAPFNPQASASAPINSAPAPFVIHAQEEVKSNVDINLDTRGTTRPVFYKPAPSAVKPVSDFGQPTVVRIDMGEAAPANKTVPPPVPRPLINQNLASAVPASIVPPAIPVPPPATANIPPAPPKPPVFQPAPAASITLKPNLSGSPQPAQTAATININVAKPAAPIRQETLRPQFSAQTMPSSKINPENIIDLKDLPR